MLAQHTVPMAGRVASHRISLTSVLCAPRLFQPTAHTECALPDQVQYASDLTYDLPR